MPFIDYTNYVIKAYLLVQRFNILNRLLRNAKFERVTAGWFSLIPTIGPFVGFKITPTNQRVNNQQKMGFPLVEKMQV